MADQDINEVLARNLKARMDASDMNQTALGKKSGVRQNTISLYLAPHKRKQGASGKAASGKLTEVAMLANALGAEAWQLLIPDDGGFPMNGWPLSPEVLAALQNASPEVREIADAQARALLKMRPSGAQETNDDAA